MRILIAADTYFPNVDGASYFTQRLARELVNRGHKVLVVAPSRTWRNEPLNHNGVPGLGIASAPTLFHSDYRFCPPIFLRRRLRSVIKKFSPNVVHVQGHFYIEAATAREARKLGIPVVGTSHFMPENLLHYGFFLTARMKEWLKRGMWWHFKLLFKHISIITTPTATAAAVLKKIGITQPVEALSCGIDMRHFGKQQDETGITERYHLPNKPLLLCVNRLAPEKNIDWILRGSAEALKNAAFHLVIVGGGKERQNLEKLTRELGIEKNVTFTGYVPDEDLPKLYPLAAVFIMAGTVELQSLVTMEAMASGLPIIAANALALPELVTAGENGLLFKPGDIVEISNCIQKLFNNEPLRVALGAASLEKIKKHDITTTINRFEAMYQQVIDKRA